MHINLDKYLRDQTPIKDERQLLSYDECWYRWISVRREYELSTRTQCTYMSAGEASSKIRKNPIDTWWLNGAPAKTSGVNACPFHTEGCSTGCVMREGRLKMPYNARLQVARTQFLFRDMYAACSLIWHELSGAVATSGEWTLGDRQNAGMDLRWEDFFPLLFDLPIHFYDYTKWPWKQRRRREDNYHLTYSADETKTTLWMKDHLNNERNVALVLRVDRDDPLPEEWGGMPMIDGDVHDFRPDDDNGVLVGLRAKGEAINDRTGFVRELD